MINQMILPETCKSDDFIISTYYLNSDTKINLLHWAKEIALDQSVGTWIKVEEESPEIMKKYGAKVVEFYTIPRVDGASCIVRIAFPTINFPNCLSMILSTVAGSLLSQKGIRPLNIELSTSAIKSFHGPSLGVLGIRKLINVYNRPLIGAILKPCIGVSPEVSAKAAVKAAIGGVDIIKDDELLSDTDYSPMVERVRVIMKYLEDVNQDRDSQVLYAVNITGNSTNLLDRARRAIDVGANALMVNYCALGWAAVEEITEMLNSEGYQVPILGHLAGAGSFYSSENNGIATHLICGKLPRLVGLDMALVYPDFGRFCFSTEELIQIQLALTADLGPITPTLPMISGGLHPGLVPYLVNLLGSDIILSAGGSIYGHPLGPTAGAKALLTSAIAAHQGHSLKKVAKEIKELRIALECWGLKEEGKKD